MGIIVLSFIIFFPAFNTFFTNDDFFLLKISKIENIGEFINFFNLTKGTDGLGMYRPLTTQVFYSLSWKFFNLNPICLHIISFMTFAGIIYLVYKLAKIVTHSENVSLIAAFLYATSATHFGHLYYLATYQELGMTLFTLLSCLFFLEYLNKQRFGKWLLSFLFFLLSLLSKETAVMAPFLIILLYLFVSFQRRSKLSAKKFIYSLIPYFLILFIYFFFRFSSYGFATGDSYIWNFSIERAVNTLGWYGLWSLNLPEMLVDFVGPGLKLNPNLLKYYSKEIIPILILFALELVILLYAFIKVIINIFRNHKPGKLLITHYPLFIILFGGAWFVLALVPVLFLPVHKFTFYLTMPLVSISVAVSYLLVSNNKKPITILFLATWFSLSILTLTLTVKTNWITKGQETARRVHNYLIENELALGKYETIVFYDTEEDKGLPWSPSGILKVVLSDNNYLKVFWNDRFSVKYYNSEDQTAEALILKLRARKFLGY